MEQSKKYLIVGIVSTLVLMLGFSVAYFTTQIIGEGKKMTVRSANLEIIFTDTSEVIVENEILPGWSTSKTFTVENKSNETFKYNISMKEFLNTFVTEYLEYKITSETGYNMEEYEELPKSKEISTVTLKEGISIEVGETHTYTINFRYRDDENVNQAEDMNKTFEGTLSIEEYSPTLYGQLLNDNPTILERTNFDNIFIEENTGTLYKATGNETEDINEDGVGEVVYYFAGNAQNNWVKFGKDQDDADLYWRIIRTNEDGSVRLLYVGPDPETESAFIKIDGAYQNRLAYNLISNNTMYVGYMYGSEGSLENNRLNTNDSNVKQKTDEWYSKTINVKTDISGNVYDTYISRTTIYCNDRAAGEYVTGIMSYAGKDRLYHNSADGRRPSYRCGYNAGGGYTNASGNWISQNEGIYNNADIADKFSVSTSKGGNGKLTYPIAQITADEIAYVGGVYGTNAPAWYYYNSANGSAVGSNYWWTMSPFNLKGGLSSTFIVRGSTHPGHLHDNVITYNTSTGIRPVLSLKSCVKWVTGDGSSTIPYEVSVDSTCVSLEN